MKHRGPNKKHIPKFVEIPRNQHFAENKQTVKMIQK